MAVNPRLPCNRFACHAAVEIVTGLFSSSREIQRALGVSNWLVRVVCNERGIEPPQATNAPKRTSASAVRAAWLNKDAPGQAVAQSVGLSLGSLRRRAKGLGLPPRASGKRFSKIVIWPTDFDEMWRAGVRTDEMAKACVPSTVWPESISRQARKRKLPKRTGGFQKKNSISLIQFRMMKDAVAVNAAAKARWKEAA